MGKFKGKPVVNPVLQTLCGLLSHHTQSHIMHSPQCLSGLCHLQTGRWHRPVPLSSSASPLAAVSSAPLHGLYSSPGGMSSETASGLWNPPNFKRREFTSTSGQTHMWRRCWTSNMDWVLCVHKPELQADSSSFEWWGTLLSHSPGIWLVTSSASSQWSNLLHHLLSTN